MDFKKEIYKANIYSHIKLMFIHIKPTGTSWKEKEMKFVYVHKSQTFGFKCMGETPLVSLTNILMQ